MRTILPLLVCVAIPTAAAGHDFVNKCVVKGKTVYTDHPCTGAMQRTAPENDTSQVKTMLRLTDEEHHQLQNEESMKEARAKSGLHGDGLPPSLLRDPR